MKLSQEELNRIEEVEEPQRDQMWLIHLRWMAQHVPDLVQDLHQNGKLGAFLDHKYQEALDLDIQLQNRHVPREQIQEILLAQILAPEIPPDMEREAEPLPPGALRLIEKSLLA
jgi:hypothetical protein